LEKKKNTMKKPVSHDSENGLTLFFQRQKQESVDGEKQGRDSDQDQNLKNSKHHILALISSSFFGSVFILCRFTSSVNTDQHPDPGRI
jgi:hypothetical protein